MPILTDDERIGTTVGGSYRLDRILGRGGMGVVYAATHGKISQLRAAVKFLNATYAQNNEVVARFMREAQAAAMLKHPNVVTVMDVGTSEDGAPYMLLEFLDGEALSAFLEKRGTVSPQELAQYIGPVMSAVAFAHDHGVVHRDIKPDNIFLSRTGHGQVVPKVLDFGIAKLTQEQSKANGTAAGGVLGTPTYMAPEQAHGEGVGPWSDVWSMGVVLYESLSGSFPFDFRRDADVIQVLTTIVSQKPISLGQRRSKLPLQVIEVVDKALAVDPRKRYRHMRELADAYRIAVERVSLSDTLAPDVVSLPGSVNSTPFVSSSIQTGQLPRQRGAFGAVAAGLGLVVAIAGGSWWALSSGAGAPTAQTMEIPSHAAGPGTQSWPSTVDEQLELPPASTTTATPDAGAPSVASAPPAGRDVPIELEPVGPRAGHRHGPASHPVEPVVTAPQPIAIQPPPPTTQAASRPRPGRAGDPFFDPSELEE